MQTVTSSSSVISSDRVAGTDVFNPAGDSLGSIDYLVIDKRSGRIRYAVMEFGGILGMGADRYPLPWSMLRYDVDKGAVCDVNPDVVRLMKACLSSHRPLGFVCLAPILAARVLGPIAGVRITLGHRGTTPAKHAAVMGADVRPCPVREIMVDQKSRVISTPAYMYDDARLPDVAVGIDKMVRAVLGLAKDRRPRPPQPQPGTEGAGVATRGPGSA